jgi:hypothetical protein
MSNMRLPCTSSPFRHSRESGNPVTTNFTNNRLRRLLDCAVKPGNDKKWFGGQPIKVDLDDSHFHRGGE